jgi:hypothetical protein
MPDRPSASASLLKALGVSLHLCAQRQHSLCRSVRRNSSSAAHAAPDKPDEMNSREKKVDRVHRRPLHLRCPPALLPPHCGLRRRLCLRVWRSLCSRRTAAAGIRLAAEGRSPKASSAAIRHATHNADRQGKGKRMRQRRHG